MFINREGEEGGGGGEKTSFSGPKWRGLQWELGDWMPWAHPRAEFRKQVLECTADLSRPGATCLPHLGLAPLETHVRWSSLRGLCTEQLLSPSQSALQFRCLSCWTRLFLSARWSLYILCFIFCFCFFLRLPSKHFYWKIPILPWVNKEEEQCPHPGQPSQKGQEPQKIGFANVATAAASAGTLRGLERDTE